MSHFGPDEAIARVADWQGKEVRWEELGGGITNHNYIVWVNGGPGQPGGGKYVLRVPGQGTDMFIDRDVERDCMIQADKAGIGPRVAYQIDPEGALVIDFVEGEIMHPETIAGHPERIKQVVETVKVVHDKAMFKNEVHIFDMLRRYTKIARDIDAPMPDELESLLVVMNDIETATGRDPVKYVACHNDLLSENFIIDAGGKMWVIDWEYGGMTDPYFDLGDFVMEHPFSREEERLIIATYCGGMSERFFGRMMLYKIVSGVWWGVWAMIQRTVSQIDFDYMDWGMERIVSRSQRGVDDPDFQRWLAEA
ncbi:MAG: choline kinase family protein [Thermoleophilia bacterium]